MVGNYASGELIVCIIASESLSYYRGPNQQLDSCMSMDLTKSGMGRFPHGDHLSGCDSMEHKYCHDRAYMHLWIQDTVSPLSPERNAVFGTICSES